MIIIFKGKEFDTEKEEIIEKISDDQYINISGQSMLSGFNGYFITGIYHPINIPTFPSPISPIETETQSAWNHFKNGIRSILKIFTSNRYDNNI